MNNWILLTYKLPTEPSARRVYVWRKLKQLGAIYIFGAVWVLPENPRTYEQFQWLAAEIQEMGGDAIFWKAQVELAGQQESLVDQFQNQVEENYRALLERMDHDPVDISAITQEYQQVLQKDYFQCEVGLQIRERLLTAREGLQ